MAHRPIALIAFVIAAVGLVATVSPGVVDGSNTIGYLRGTEHGRRSTSTTYEAPALTPMHRWRNEDATVGFGGGQIEPIVPENAGGGGLHL